MDEDCEGCDLCTEVIAPLPSGRWSWWRLAADVSCLSGNILASFGQFLGENMYTHFSFCQNRQIDLDDSRDFAAEVLQGISILQED